mmetsp:Transcript_2585/g.7793  ORF Transcript_2585/g.7793 Transcript_2585/m.7793 type:complete len:361 (-) Transcript_2585:294-1376(-)
MDVEEVHQHGDRGHALEHYAQGLLADLWLEPRLLGQPLQVHQGVHGPQGRRHPVEALEPEALLAGVRDPVDDALAHGGGPRLALPACVRCALADLDVQQAQGLAAVVEVAHHEQLCWLIVTGSPLHCAAEDAGVFEHEAVQALEGAPVRLFAVLQGVLVEVDLVPGVAEVLADVVLLGPPRPEVRRHLRPQLQPEKGRGAARDAQPLDASLEPRGLDVRHLLVRAAAALLRAAADEQRLNGEDAGVLIALPQRQLHGRRAAKAVAAARDLAAGQEVVHEHRHRAAERGAGEAPDARVVDGEDDLVPGALAHVGQLAARVVPLEAQSRARVCLGPGDLLRRAVGGTPLHLCVRLHLRDALE